jgi:hypothetical protein
MVMRTGYPDSSNEAFKAYTEARTVLEDRIRHGLVGDGRLTNYWRRRRLVKRSRLELD